MSRSIRCSPRQLRVLAPHIYTSGLLAHIHIVLGDLVLCSFSFLPARVHMLQRPSIARFFPAQSPLCMMVVPIRISLHGCCGSGGGGGTAGVLGDSCLPTSQGAVAVSDTDHNAQAVGDTVSVTDISWQEKVEAVYSSTRAS